MKTFAILFLFFCICMGTLSCSRKTVTDAQNPDSIMIKLNDFAEFTLSTDVSVLSAKEREMLPLLIEAAGVMDEIFWLEAFGEKKNLFQSIKQEGERTLVEINYGPWERLNGNKPFLQEYGNKPLGANFYPADMTKEEFEEFADPAKSSLYTLVRRNEKGELTTVPYHVAFGPLVEKAAGLINQAAELAEDAGLKHYLQLRAKALLTDDYYMSDLAWMDMKSNTIDFVAGPIETYEDQLFGFKAAHEAYVLVKDKDWSNRLNRYATLLPMMQKGLPVEERYRADEPGSSSDLGAYDVLYYAGDCNAGSKTIAINLPNDERVQQARGSRRLQLKNAMQAKFDKILVPIAGELIDAGQMKHVTFDAFFSNTMFHEIAHGLGNMNTITGKGSVREALKDHYTTIEEGKADILGLYLETKLHEMGEWEADLMDSYTTFLAGIFRSIRFGASSAHGKANLIRFNYFKEKGAFTMNAEGRYQVNFNEMKAAITDLSAMILVMQGDGDYEKAAAMIRDYGKMDDSLKASLKKIEEKDIPVDIVFNQGVEALGLNVKH